MPLELIPTDEKQALDSVLERFNSPEWKEIDQVEQVLEKMPRQEMPLRHIFTPGIYIREIFMPANTLLVTRIHLVEHPFFILKGVVSVWTLETGWVRYSGPYHGVTSAGTRRVLVVHEDTVWVTTHATDLTDPDEIVKAVTFSEGKYAALGAAASQPLLQDA